jgi:hypothetical protein
MQGIPTRILIWAKTYPELSNRYRETVCTGGCTEDGRPIRIYPVPVRYLPTLHRYRLFNWIEAPIALSTRDPRPESFRITDVRKIRVLGHLDTKRGWLQRRQIIFQDRSWHYECVDDLKAARKRAKTSMGIVRVGEVTDVRLAFKPASARRAHDQKLAALMARRSVFGATDAVQKELEFLPFAVRIHWKCSRLDGPLGCRGHSASVMDWGLGELGRREGPDAALGKMKEIADVSRRDLHLFMGNLKARPHVFGVVGLFYPKLTDVLKYPLHPGLWDSPGDGEPPMAPDEGSQLPLL